MIEVAPGADPLRACLDVIDRARRRLARAMAESPDASERGRLECQLGRLGRVRDVVVVAGPWLFDEAIGFAVPALAKMLAGPEALPLAGLQLAVDTFLDATSASIAHRAAAPSDAMLGTAATPPPNAFHAHPKIGLDRSPLPGQPIRILVGFSETADAEADFQMPIDLADAQPDETLDVLVSVTGATLQAAWRVSLPLDLYAQRSLAAVVDADATEVKLAASYLFRQRLVGTIGKTIAIRAVGAVGAVGVLGTATAAVRVEQPPAPTWVPALADADTTAPVDIILVVQRRGPDTLEWKACLTATGRTVGPFAVPLGDATSFAKRLAGIAALSARQPDRGLLDVVDVGQTVAALIPDAILDDVLTPALAAGRVPTVLLFTDEPFVPWELARLSPRQAARPAAAFLGEVACIGRWWLHASSTGPVSSARIRRVSAVAATAYDDGANDTLEHAIEERRMLVRRYQAEKVEARADSVRAWLASPVRAGHLAHLALHGYSDPASEEEGLILGDGTHLTPIRLSGEWHDGEIPRFAVVFLNACQVGTAGRRLGQMSGFPGVLIRNGVSAFIAPLWEVDDAVAGSVAETVYAKVLEQGQSVGETLRALREAPRLGDSITPLAYAYYGHPALRLQRDRPRA